MSYITVSPNLTIGEVYSTTYVFEAPALASASSWTWDMGDGNLQYGSLSASCIFKHPGTYRVGLSAWLSDGFLVTDYKDVTVKYVYEDNLIFSQIPADYSMCGIPTEDVFVLSLTSARINEQVAVSLESFNSNSLPYYGIPENNKWGFMNPSWKFVDANTGKLLSSPIKINTSPLYKDSTVVAVSGQLAFRYIDDSHTDMSEDANNPVLIVARLSAENFVRSLESNIYPYKSFSNTKITKAFVPWHINKIPVTNFKISENYLNDVYPLKWTGVKIPLCITPKFNRDDLLQNTFYGQFSSVDVWEYPRTNEIGQNNPFKLILSSDNINIEPDHYTVNGSYAVSASPLYFQNTDNKNNNISGYVFASIVPLTAFPESVFLTLSTTTNTFQTTGFEFPIGFPLSYGNPIYVSNQYKCNINKIQRPVPVNSNIQTQIQQELEEQSVNVTFLPTPMLSVYDVFAYEVSGTSAVYGLAINPIHKRLYGLDADQDALYAFNTTSLDLLSTVLLSSISGQNYNTPSSLSLDSEGNVWVALWSGQLLLKFDSNLNYILSAAPTITVPLTSISEGSPLVAPPIVETDQDDNVWACYAHPVSSMLVKFDSEGNQLFKSEQLSFSSVPVSLAITPQQNVWTANYNANNIELFAATDGSLLSSVGGFIHPSYIALDRQSNLWFTHGYNFCSVYNVTTMQLSTWKYNYSSAAFEVASAYSEEDVTAALYENEVWGGLSIDVYNNVWLIDKENNKILNFLDSDPSSLISIDPQPIPSTGGSIQAAGDWTGNKWYQKYANTYNLSKQEKTKSSSFGVYDLDGRYNIAKIDEEFNFAAHMKSLALPEILSKNDNFFDNFLGAVVGNGNILNEEIGKTVYDKTANFLNNHANIDTAQIDQLLSLAEQTAVPSTKFGISFPTEVDRLLNLFSVPKHCLRGYEKLNSFTSDNIGKLLTENSLISAQQYIFVKEKKYDQYQLIYVNSLSSDRGMSFVYPLSNLQAEALKYPIFDHYYFFEYVQENIGYTNNIINWDSKQTTITYNLSTEEQWYGDQGIAETMFNNLLTKRLVGE